MELAWGRRFAGRQEQTERAPPEPLSVRSLTIAASVFIVILVVAAVASLVWSGLDTRRATDEWLRATQGQALVDAALVDLLTFRRLSDLWVVTGDPRVEGERRRAATELATDLAGARTLAVDPRERALLDLASHGVADYLAHRRAVEASTHDLQVIVTQTSPYVDRVARTLEAIRALHRDDIRAAYSEIRGTIVRTDVIGAGLALLLLGAMVALLAGAGRWIVAPVLSLHRALEAFRGGELGARAPERGAREVRDLSHAYNAMADTLAAQREGSSRTSRAWRTISGTRSAP
ncbi:MAG: HAMP domain-containing protein [Sandaracinaceae bacterium]|nr:HAMP domain-containing protein [Sandaracinaceae bacterium]